MKENIFVEKRDFVEWKIEVGFVFLVFKFVKDN